MSGFLSGLQMLAGGGKSLVHGESLADLHGQAKLYKFTTDIPLEPLFRPEGSLAVPLGRNQEHKRGERNPANGFFWPLDMLQGHMVGFGATRSGKGVCGIIPALLTYRGSVVVIDPKGENAWVTAERRRKLGQRVVILDPWGEVNGRYGSQVTPPVEERTSRFNPLGALDPASKDFADDVALLADALIIPGTGDPHWTNSARELVAGLIAAAVELHGDAATLRDVRHAAMDSSENLKGMVDYLRKLKPDSLGAAKLTRFTEGQNTGEIGSIRSTALTQTAFLDSVALVENMDAGAAGDDEPPFDLAELATGRVTLYLVLPVDKLETHGRWLRLILTQAIRAIARQRKLPEAPVLFLLDEAGTIGPLRMVEQAFGLMAGLGIRISMYLQDLVQLQRDYPRSWETFISNASVLQVLKVGDKTTSEYLSDLMGTRTIHRTAASTIMDKGLINRNAEGAGDQFFPRKLFLPQELRSVPDNLIVNYVAGIGTFELDRMPYYQEPAWRDWYRPIPGFETETATESAGSPVEATTGAPGQPWTPPVDLGESAKKAAGWIGDKIRAFQAPRNSQQPPEPPSE